MVEFRILGGLQCLAGSEQVLLGGARQRAVLGLLLVEAPASVSMQRLIDELWVDRPPSTAAHAVEVYVSALRKALRESRDEAVLRYSAGAYALDIDPERLDARRFERMVDEAEHLVHEDAVLACALLERALELWRGPPLENLSQFEFARREADRLREIRSRAVESLAAARLECGEPGDVIAGLTELVAANPLRERPRRLLMLALYRAGRHAEALAAYRDACGALTELGLQPGPELRDLEALILRHDSSLKPAPPAVPPNGRLKRKMVTALCCDLIGRLARAEGLDPEARLSVLDRRFEEMRRIVQRHGGSVVSSIGDSAAAIFGVPRLHEDDALRAVRAAAELSERLSGPDEPMGHGLSPRIGVNTGLALVGERDRVVLGDAIDLAARLERAAEPGQILLGPETLELVRHAVHSEPVPPPAPGADGEPVAAARLIAVAETSRVHGRHPAVPMVGRQRELGVLRAVWKRVVEERGCHLFTLLGPAGIGKSRLVQELLATVVDAATVLSGRCLPYGDGITFWPLIEALEPVGGPALALLERIAAGGTTRPEELFWEVRQVLNTAALERPVILHIDDLQWAEPMLLDLLDSVAHVSRGAPILLLCAGRTELLDERPGWGGGKLNAGNASLEPLAPRDCARLLAELAGYLDQDARARVVEASEGNPLFLEELAVLARDHAELAMPPTILALLAARLERLEPVERELLEHGAIEGEVFHLATVRALDSSAPLAQVRTQLDGLVRKDLIRPQSATPLGDEAFRFRHILIRDAAYEGLAKTTRASLHQSFADWLEREAPDLAELDEIAGWHLEQAASYRREIETDGYAELAHRAARHLLAAGRRAAQRGDTAAARKLLERSHALAISDRRLLAQVAVDLAEQLIEGGDLGRVDALLSAAERDAHTAAHAALVRLHWLTLARPAEGPRTIEANLPDMLRRLAAAGDELGLAKAHLAGFWATSQLAMVGPAAEHALLAAAHARAGADEGLRSRAQALYVVTLCYGSKDAATITSELDVIEAEQPGPYLRTLALAARSEATRLTGDVNEFRRLMQDAIGRFRAMGIQTMAAACQNYLAWAEVSHGDCSRVLAGLLQADADLAQLGERGFRSTVQATLAQVHERLGGSERAGRAVELAERLTAPTDHLNLVMIAAVRARLALRSDDLQTAERSACSGLEHALQTDIPFLKGEAHLELARVLRAKREDRQAHAAAASALDYFRVRGDEPRAGVARALLSELEARLEHAPA